MNLKARLTIEETNMIDVQANKDIQSACTNYLNAIKVLNPEISIEQAVRQLVSLIESSARELAGKACSEDELQPKFAALAINWQPVYHYGKDFQSYLDIAVDSGYAAKLLGPKSINIWESNRST